MREFDDGIRDQSAARADGDEDGETEQKDPSSQGPHNERARGVRHEDGASSGARVQRRQGLPRTRQGRLDWFRGLVSQKCGLGRDVPTDHEALGQENAATAARVRSRRRATCDV